MSRSPTRSLSPETTRSTPSRPPDVARPPAEPGGPGAGQHLEHRRARGVRGRVGGVVDRGEVAARRADRQHVADAHRWWPEVRQRVGRAGAEHRRHVDATAHGEVGAQARGRHPQGEGGPVRHVDEGGVRDRPPVDGGRGGRAGDRDGQAPPGPHGEATEQHLERRVVLRVPDEARPEPVRRAVGGPGATDPHGGQARAAGVLDQHEGAGGEHLERRAHGSPPRSTKRTVVPGASRAGGSRSTSQSRASVVPSSCQPPGDERG